MFFRFYPHAPPAVPATAPNPEYPIHIRIPSTHWNWFRQEGVHGYGRANLLRPSPKGAEFTYSCDEPFMQNTEPGEFYQAKWRKPDQDLTLLLQKVGSNRTTKSDVKVALHDTPYGRPVNAAAPASSTQPAAPAALAQSRVTDSISSNGAVQINQADPTISMKAILYDRDEASATEDKFVSILHSHQDDPDIQHRLAEITKPANLQAAIAPQATRSPESAKPSRDRRAIASSARNGFLGNSPVDCGVIESEGSSRCAGSRGCSDSSVSEKRAY